MDPWDRGVIVLNKFSSKHPQMDYYGLGMSMQLKWKYLNRISPKVGSLMGPIKRSLREALLTMLFGGEDVNDSTQEIILHRVK